MEIKLESPFFPPWAQRVADLNNAFVLKLLTVKKLEASDISEHHNGFLLPRDVVENKLVPYLTGDEREKASLLTFNEKRRRDGRQGSSSSATRNYEGLNVSVYVEGGWRIVLLLTHNDRNGQTVLKGNELENLRRFGNLKEGDSIAIWMLRYRDEGNDNNKFCFCFVKIDLSLFGDNVKARASEITLEKPKSPNTSIKPTNAIPDNKGTEEGKPEGSQKAQDQ